MKSCNAFMKRYHLKNVWKTKEKLHWFARNRFRHWQNPVLSERYKSEFKKYHAGTGSPIGTTRFLVQKPGTCFLRKAGTRFPVIEEPVPKGLFSKIHFERYFKQSFLDLKVMKYVYVDECILWTSIFKILRIIYTIFDIWWFFNNSSIIFKTFIWCW